MKNYIYRLIETITLILTILVGLIISVLDLTGLLDSSPMISKRSPAITLLCVAFVASYLILERKNNLYNYNRLLTFISSSSSQIIKSLKGVEIKVYHSKGDFAQVLLSKLKEAKQVDSLVWTKRRPEPAADKDNEFYRKYSKVSNEIMQKRDIVWREVFIPDENLVKRCEERLLNTKIKGYYAGYYEQPAPENLPRFSFMIINKKELFLFRLPDILNIRLYICHEDLVKYFSNFYTIIWNESKKIKEDIDTDFELLNNLKNKIF